VDDTGTERLRLPAITISRQRGSGADAIAALVAQQLRIPLYDRQVITRAAREAGVSPEAVVDAERTKGFLSRMLEALARTAVLSPDVPVVLPPTPDALGGALVATSADVRAIIEQVLRQLADAGPAVIVGHGSGQVALRGRPDALHVFIHAPFAQRVARMMTYGRLSQEEAERDVEEVDRERTAFFKDVYDLNWYDLRLYDLVINSGGRSYAEVADEICRATGVQVGRAASAAPEPRLVHA
jgi:cytidylate kinase